MQPSLLMVFSEGCSIIMLYLIGLDLSKQTQQRHRAMGMEEGGAQKSAQEEGQGRQGAAYPEAPHPVLGLTKH